VPARLTVLASAAAAAVLGLRPRDVLRVCLRDGRKHASPNSGLAESAMAGALGVQLGGPLRKRGDTIDCPLLGDPLHALEPRHIEQAVRMMAVTTTLWTGALLGVSALLGRRHSQRG
jgi:adenosylcobinamide-phosphate synthase